jgi:membrane-associated protease RseP (regulator of RpoE activity)
LKNNIEKGIKKMITATKHITNGSQNTETFALQGNWLYKVGGVAALLAMGTNLYDIIHGIGGTGAAAYGTRSAIEWFAVYQTSAWEGLYSLGILNIVYMAAMLPVYTALFTAHRRKQVAPALLSVIVFLLATSIYISTNAAIPLLALSQKYALASTDAQRAIFLAAGEAVLSRGEDFTAGSFIPLFLGGLAALAISVVMLRDNIFGKATAWVGIMGFSFLSLFTICATFFPVLYTLAFYGFASIGGTLALIWFALVARRLFRLGKNGEEDRLDKMDPMEVQS